MDNSKTLLLFIVLAAFACSLHAQGYQPLALDGKTWVYEDSHGGRTERWVVEGDSIEDGVLMKKINVYKDDGGLSYSWIVSETDGKCMMDGGLVYDFNASAGDTTSVYSTLCQVVSVEPITVRGHTFKRFHLKIIDGKYSTNTYFYYVSEIGGSKALYDPANLYTGNNLVFRTCIVNGDTIFTDADFLTPDNRYCNMLDSLTWTMKLNRRDGLSAEYWAMTRSARYPYLIPGVLTMRMDEHRWKEGETEPMTWTAMREAYVKMLGGRVYVSPRGSSGVAEHTVADFSAQVGDVVSLYETDGSSYSIVAIRDTVFANSTDRQPRRCLYVENVADPTDRDVWVDGIGSLRYGVLGDMYGEGVSVQLVSVRRGDEVLYMAEHDETGVDSPTAAPRRDGHAPLYDLTGRRVSVVSKRHGLYIRNHQKIIQ